MSDLTALAGATQALGVSCAHLLQADHGAVAALRSASSAAAAAGRDGGDVLSAIDGALRSWGEVQGEIEAARGIANSYATALAGLA